MDLPTKGMNMDHIYIELKNPKYLSLAQVYQFILSWPDPEANQTAPSDELLAGNSEGAVEIGEVCNEQNQPN